MDGHAVFTGQAAGANNWLSYGCDTPAMSSAQWSLSAKPIHPPEAALLVSEDIGLSSRIIMGIGGLICSFGVWELLIWPFFIAKLPALGVLGLPFVLMGAAPAQAWLSRLRPAARPPALEPWRWLPRLGRLRRRRCRTRSRNCPIAGPAAAASAPSPLHSRG